MKNESPIFSDSDGPNICFYKDKRSKKFKDIEIQTDDFKKIFEEEECQTNDKKDNESQTEVKDLLSINDELKSKNIFLDDVTSQKITSFLKSVKK
jgi:hypothetical protein